MKKFLKKTIKESRKWANINRVISAITLILSLSTYVKLINKGGAYGFDSPYIYASLIIVPCLFFLIIVFSILVRRSFFMILFWDLVILVQIYILLGINMTLNVKHFL